MSTIAERPENVMTDPTVAGAIRELAGENEETWGLLQGRAVEAVRTARNLAAKAGKELPEEAFVDIACQAVKTLEDIKAYQEVYQALVGWLGPTNVPNQLGFSWYPAKPTLRKGAKAEAAKEEAAPRVQAEEPLSEAQTSEIVAQVDEMRTVDRALIASYDALKAAGRIEGLEFMRRVSEVAIAQQFAQVRADKSYKGLPYKAEDGRIRSVETIEEFCQAFLGKSYKRCTELAQNLHTLGPALYEQAQSIGFKAKDYRALKALPAEEQKVVKEALESESREQVLDILQEMAARHAAEREALKKSEADLKADLEARDGLLKDKADRMRELEIKLEKLQRLPEDKAWQLKLEKESEAVKRLNDAHLSALSGMKSFLVIAAEILQAEGITLHTQTHAEALVIEVFQHLTDYAAEHVPNARLDVEVNPFWSREQAEAELRGDVK